MLSRRLARLQATPSRVFAARVRFYGQKVDPLDQSRQSGYAASNHGQSSPVDAASREGGKKAAHGELIGNKEGVGFADQVGSQSTSDSSVPGGKPESSEGIVGQENITPPSFVDAVKNKLGFKTTAGEDKQNRGGGKGVTGTGRMAYDRAKRTMYTSATSRAPAKTQGQAPEASRQPKDKTHADQNDHLKHKSKAASADTGKGNAAQDPKLPSHQTKTAKGQKRAFHTTASTSQDKDENGHTADSYFKDVDSTAPVNPKVHQVDSSSDTGAPVARANEQPATGNFSRTGPSSPEYETQTSKHDQPYDTKPTEGPEADQKLRYGGRPAQDNTNKSDEGPTGKSAVGRKPEGR